MSLTRLQVQTSGPLPDTLLTGTDMLVPDEYLKDRLDHFDPDLFDLRDSSHLSRFLSAMLGETGAGGLRKSYLINRLRNAMQSTHFLDLDRFYGALFGVRRRLDEILPINPETGALLDPHKDQTDPDTWDEIALRDAAYRQRIVKFAKAIPLGASVPGLRQAAEALLDVPVQIYETWELLDQLVRNADGTYVAPGTKLVGLGRLPLGNRAEVIVRPMRPVTHEEHSDVLRVLSRLKPAGTALTVDSDGVALHSTMTLRNVAADSEYWELRRSVTKRTDGGSSNLHVYGSHGGPDEEHAYLPEPPFSRAQGVSASFVDSVVSMTSYSAEEDVQISDTSTHVITHQDGEVEVFSADKALIDLAASEGGVASGEDVSNPYSEDYAFPSINGAP